MKWTHLPLLAVLSLAACDGAADHRGNAARHDLSGVDVKGAFTCTYEKDRIPPRDPEADELYRYARWLRKNNLLRQKPHTYPKIERLIRIAAAHGHDKANLELRVMFDNGQALSEDYDKEKLALIQELIDRGIPGGYYDMGVRKNSETALKFFRKSADLGSPEGQFLVAEKLDPPDMAPDIAKQMFQCAAEQGHGAAALSWALGCQSLEQNYPEALLAFQLGAKAGNESAASFLSKGFNGPPSTDRLYYLGQQKDEERFRRYDSIRHFLHRYSYLNPKVPEIDEIVPLPPAKLPAWDGSFQWLKEHEANVPPPLPTEERIREMALDKNLDPQTGRPLKAGQPRPQAKPDVPAALRAAPLAPGEAAREGRSRVEKGRALYDAGDYDEAIAALDEALRFFAEAEDIGEPLAAALTSKGMALFAKGQYPESIALFDEVIRRFDKEKAGNWVAIAMFFKGMAFFDDFDSEKALAVWEAADRRHGEDKDPEKRLYTAKGLYFRQLMLARISHWEQSSQEKYKAYAVAINQFHERYGQDADPEIRALLAQSLLPHLPGGTSGLMDQLPRRYGDDKDPAIRILVAEAIARRRDDPAQAYAIWDEVAHELRGAEGEKERLILIDSLAMKARAMGRRSGPSTKEVAALYDEIDKLCGKDKRTAVRVKVAEALHDKGHFLAEHKEIKEALRTFDEIIDRYQESEVTAIYRLVNDARSARKTYSSYKSW